MKDSIQAGTRRMVRVTGAYIVGAWIVLQVADVVAPALDLPAWTVGLLVWTAVAGLPVVIAGAWLLRPRDPLGAGLDQSAIGVVRPARAPRTAAARRLIVLPFRVLNPDAETDFLAAALPDAITCSLAGLRSLIVRSSVASVRFDATTDLRQVAQEADVDVVLTGTLQRGGRDLEVRTQLTDASDGAVLSSQTLRGRIEDLFHLQDRVARRIVESLELPLTDNERRGLAGDIPSSPEAFELYLRGNQMSVGVGQWAPALQLYHACLREDPDYAPAWARAGRCHRLIGKYSLDPEVAEVETESARAAFTRALELNPDLHVAHSFLADLEVDDGQAERAVVRLLGRLAASGRQPEVLAGLVHACRFCGLLDASLRAAQLAKRADPKVRTSETHTHFMSLDYSEALRTYNEADIGYMQAIALIALGRSAEARERIRLRLSSLPEESLVSHYLTSLQQMLDGKTRESAATINLIAPRLADGEAIFYLARQLAYMGQTVDSLRELRRSAAKGFFCLPVVERDPWLNDIRPEPDFGEYLGAVSERHERAVRTFVEAEGPRLLGLGDAPVASHLPG